MNRSSLILLLIVCSVLTAQPKREFRAAWVATVSNIDWPLSKNHSATQQKADAIAILDKHKQNNINAILLQVRPSCDAIYQGGLEPLSEYLVGTQGGNLSSYYDPLQFWIDEAHKRGMELHAWFNPYRAVVSSGSSVHATHISKTKPEWIITYGASPYKLLDPGIPAVQNYSLSVIMDVVRRYNIDGVHFDDYFYPYGGMGNQDSATFANYKGAFTSLGDWRRNNVNKFIAMVHDSIKATKYWVKFGVSPFGIWKSGTPAGVSGLDAYSAIYCDAVNWLQNKKVDYITPQMYWVIGGGQDYSKLMPWWVTQLNGRHLYSGNAVYRLSATESNWPASEIQNQIELNRVNNRALGFVAFSSKSLTNNLKGVGDSLRNNQFKYRALHPPMPWLDNVLPLAPVNLAASIAGNAVQLQWQKGGTASDGDTSHYVAVYRATSPDTVNINNVKQIIAITTRDTLRYTDNSAVAGASYSYAVTSFDKLHNESPATAKLSVSVVGIEQETGTPQRFALQQNFPNPFNPVTTITFQLPTAGYTTVTIYDIVGREVAVLADGMKEAGSHSVQFNGANLASGVYLYRIVSGPFVQTRKMVLQK
ncbi:MAG: family 10 glycosylhydrolase [Bacteroidetes bacterium]|nr:family 10 glycosylhydrolase [Bacteroidota bacterium]